MTRRILSVFVLSSVLLGCQKASQNADTKGSPDTKTAPALDADNPDFTVTAVALREEYNATYAKARAKYLGKTIRVTGKVIGYFHARGVIPGITLEGTSDIIDVVRCGMEDKEPWGKYTPGQMVTVVGRMKGDCWLEGCIVVDSEPNLTPPATLTSEKFAEEITASRAEAETRYTEKWVILTGEVVGIDFRSWPESNAVVELKGDGKTKVKGNFSSTELKFVHSLKDAQRIKTIGKVKILSPTVALLQSCVLYDSP